MVPYLDNWYKEFIRTLSDTRRLRIISPFVSKEAILDMQGRFDFNNFELITRFNLNDFASGASSLDALQIVVNGGARVYGIKDLHSKVYLFDGREAIVTSANLTMNGLKNNYECGLRVTDNNLIKSLSDYFDSLLKKAGTPLVADQCKDWEREILSTKTPKKGPSLPDYGAKQQTGLGSERSYFVKFLGNSNIREPLSASIRDVIDSSLCHYAVGFSQNKKPRQFKGGDVIYIARMTSQPNDYAIFGKAEAIKYDEKRDEATEREMVEREWKRRYPIYLRVRNPVFIDGTLQDCVMLYDLIDEKKHNSFCSTKQRYENGERGVEPKRSLSQQPYVKLTPEAAEWIDRKFDRTLGSSGQVDKSFLNRLPQSDTKVD